MLFSEIYGSYFNVVAAVLSEASDGKLTDRRMTELVREKAFAESALAIPAALKSGTWPLLDQEYHSILHHKPTMPLTMLQKRWLKALLSDPRIALFDPDTTGLEDVDPLYAQDTFILFDQYADGDPYGDPAYIACFQTALKAIRKKRKLRIRFRGHTGARHSIECIPYRLEYSAKDDKFRLLATGKRRLNTINMARVRSCELLDAYDPKSITLPQENSEELVMLLHDERTGWNVCCYTSPILKKRLRSWPIGSIRSGSVTTRTMRPSCLLGCCPSARCWKSLNQALLSR